jgi:OOP family OmpA-OmpF porin
MKFRIKRTLIGVATASLLAPMASHAAAAPGKWVFDGLQQSVKDGQGSTCVGAGGDDHAFDAPDCTSAAETAAAARRADAEARAAAKAEAAAAAKAAREDTLLAVEPGSALAPGEKGAYVYQLGEAPVRDGFGRSCVKHGFWGAEYATEECHPELFNAWRARQAQPEQELAPRIALPPPEATPAAVAEEGGPEQPDAGPGLAPAAAAAAAAAAPVVDNTVPEFPVTTYDYVAPAAAFVPFVVVDAEPEEEEEPLAEEDFDDEDPPVFAQPEPLAIPEGEPAGLVEDEEEEPDLLAEDDEDDLPTPDMMLSEADRTLPAEAAAIAGVAALAALDDEDEEEAMAALDDEEDELTTPEMMLSEEHRTLPGDEPVSPGVAVLTDTSPGVAPPAEKVVETPPVVDNTIPEFPVTTYEAETLSPGVAVLTDTSPGVAPPAEQVVETPPVVEDTVADFPVTTYQVEPAPAKKPPPTELPVTIRVEVDEDGYFDFDKYELRDDMIDVLDAVVGMLNDAKYDSIDVIGHADPIGTMRYNQALSERRAAAVKKYLVAHGIDPARINTSGKGEMELLVTREDCKGLRKQALIKCLQPNRRVDIQAAGTKTGK